MNLSVEFDNNLAGKCVCLPGKVRYRAACCLSFSFVAAKKEIIPIAVPNTKPAENNLRKFLNLIVKESNAIEHIIFKQLFFTYCIKKNNNETQEVVTQAEKRRGREIHGSFFFPFLSFST